MTARSFGFCGRVLASLLLSALFLAATVGCVAVLNARYKKTVTHAPGSQVLVEGLGHPVTIARDSLGIPFIEAQDLGDLAFGMGYVHAADRLTQMVGFKLVAQGRLAEMIGERGLEVDLYMRALNLDRFAALEYEAASDEVKLALDRYAAGVNAYLELYADRLPPEFDLSGYRPERWQPFDSLSIYGLVTLGLASNLNEEIGILNIAHSVGAENLPWLIPIYPDEPLPVDEAAKLEDIDLAYLEDAIAELREVQEQLVSLTHVGTVASNNWAVSKERTKTGASIFSNDTHLPLMFPSMWNYMHAKCPEYHVGGVSVAGAPGIVAGYNGHIAWGMTMVMGDNQDLFLERIEEREGRLHYLHEGRWFPVEEREETFKIKGAEPVHRVIHETIHGPLISEVLTESSSNDLVPPLGAPYAIAASWAVFEADRSWEAFLEIGRADSVNAAAPHVKRIRAIALNLVYADKENIAWQVTGRYPVRRKGRGLVPSPGWTGEYDWDGYLPVESQPSAVNPPAGFIGTANNKTVGPDYPHILSSSWFYPERAERIHQLLGSAMDHTAADTRRMQYERHSLYVAKLKAFLFEDGMRDDIMKTIAGWDDEGRRAKALEAMDYLLDLEEELLPSSTPAALLGAFNHAYLHNTFKDELGGEDSTAWRSFLDILRISYSALPDHLLLRGDESPFWDDVDTPGKETKVEVLARSLADAVEYLEHALGKKREKWEWGRLHTYHWINDATKDPDMKGMVKRIASKFFNRGPVAAGGDHTTLNAASYSPGRSFDTWIVPAMRILVDFSAEEPLEVLNSSGQSGNPTSEHYDDGIEAWLEGNYQPMPFQEQNIASHYFDAMTLMPRHGPVR